jgi:L-fuculose-phosphate aldolase
MNNIKSKAHYSERASKEMAENLELPKLSVRQQLTVAARMMALEGHDAGAAGQLTAKGEEPGTYWTLRLGWGFEEATPCQFLLVDDDLKTLEGAGHPNPATRFHMWVYKARPDLNAIFHAHPPYISAMSMLETPLVISHMDQTPFAVDCAFLAEWPGLPIADEEGRIISEALGDKMSIILAHHGYLTCGKTVSEASFLSIYLERAARMHMRAAAVGPVKPVPDDLAKDSHRFMTSPMVIDTTFAYFARLVIKQFGHEVLDEI